MSADRERAARRIEQILSQMEENGSQEEAESLRTQLNHLLPTVWEEELSAKMQALFPKQSTEKADP